MLSLSSYLCVVRQVWFLNVSCVVLDGTIRLFDLLLFSLILAIVASVILGTVTSFKATPLPILTIFSFSKEFALFYVRNLDANISSRKAPIGSHIQIARMQLV